MTEELTQEHINDLMFEFASRTLVEEDGIRGYKVLNELYESDRTTRWYLSAPDVLDSSRGVKDFKMLWVSFDKSEMAIWGDVFVWNDVVNAHIEVGEEKD